VVDTGIAFRGKKKKKQRRTDIIVSSRIRPQDQELSGSVLLMSIHEWTQKRQN
jgi:hypothetical protein